MNICTINDTALTPLWVSPEENTLQTVKEILTGFSYSANLLFGLPTNGYVLWLIVRGRQEKIASDFIPLNQIVVEILLCLTSILYFLDLNLPLNPITQLFFFLSIVFLVMRPLVQSYICLEQYLATVHPVVFLRCKPLRYKVAGCCVSWLIGITLAVAGIASNSLNKFFLMIAALYVFLFLLMTFCCFSVLRALKRPGPGEGQRDQHRGNSMKKKAFKIILVNLVYTTMSQLPMVVVSCFMGKIPYPLFNTLKSVNICIFVITGFVPAMLYLYRVGKLYRKCDCL